MNEQEISEKAVAYLQSLFDADPSAVHALCCNRVPCNQAICDHPHAVVDCVPVLENAPPVALGQIGMLGVINGLLTSLGCTPVASKWDREQGPRPAMIGFQQFVQAEAKR